MKAIKKLNLSRFITGADTTATIDNTTPTLPKRPQTYRSSSVGNIPDCKINSRNHGNKNIRTNSMTTLENKTTLTSTSKTNHTIESMLIRFKECQQNTLKKIEAIKKRIDEEELSTLKAIPEIKIKKTKFKLENEDFLKRMEIKKIELENKKIMLKSKEMKKRVQMESLYLNPKLNQKIDPKIIQEKIDNMIRWDEERKDKLRIKQHEMERKLSEKCTFSPDISQNSKRIAEEQIGRMNNKVTLRLYNNEYIRSKQMLTDNNFERGGHTANSSVKNLLQNLMTTENLETMNTYLKTSYNENLQTMTVTNTLPDLGVSIIPKQIDYISKKESQIVEEILKLKNILK